MNGAFRRTLALKAEDRRSLAFGTEDHLVILGLVSWLMTASRIVKARALHSTAASTVLLDAQHEVRIDE